MSASEAADAPSQSPAGAGGGNQQRDFLRLVGLGAAIGLPAAGLAALFLALVTQLQHWLWRDLPSDLGTSTPPWYLVIGLPVVGALLVIAARRLLPGDGGNPPLQGFAGEGATPLAYGPGIALAALATLGFGAVLGPEMPLVALGSVAGTALGRAARLPDKQTTVLALSGSFSAISALFGGPIVGGLLMLEGGWRWARRSSRCSFPASWPPRSATSCSWAWATGVASMSRA